MQGQGFSLDALRKMVEDKVCEAVYGVVERIPNGQQYKDQFRQAIGGAMDSLQQQAQSQMSQLDQIDDIMGDLGGMRGKRPQQHPPVH